MMLSTSPDQGRCGNRCVFYFRMEFEMSMMACVGRALTIQPLHIHMFLNLDLFR